MWQYLYAYELPVGLVELRLREKPDKILRGRFLWNGFWELDDESIIGGGRVLCYRSL